MASFSFCFIVEINSGDTLISKLPPEKTVKLSDLLNLPSKSMIEMDAYCNKFMQTIHSQYFPDLPLSLDGSGYTVSDGIRENLYIVHMDGIDAAKSFMKKITKILEDNRNTDNLKIDNIPAYMNMRFFNNKVIDFGRDITGYEILKDLDF